MQDIWNQILDFFGNDDFNVRVYGTFMVSMVIYWGVGGIFTFVDLTGKPNFALKYKVQENVKSYPISKAQFLDLVTVVLKNQSLNFVLSILAFYADVYRGIKYPVQIPPIINCIGHLAFFVAIREITFYYSHRLFHYPYFYKRIHKKHHTWISPVAISASLDLDNFKYHRNYRIKAIFFLKYFSKSKLKSQKSQMFNAIQWHLEISSYYENLLTHFSRHTVYCHPIEQIVSNVLPIVLGPALLNSHTILLWAFIVYSTIETLTGHSGFHFPLLKSPEFHDFHHLKFNYNYGVIGLLDYLHGTDSLFRTSKQFLRNKRTFTLTPIKVTIP